MTTLTSAQKARFRAQCGDTNTTPKIDDTTLQSLYDSAASDEPTTMVYLLRWLVGLAVDEIQFSQGDQQKSGNQHYEQLERLLAYWENKAGMTGGLMTIGRMTLELDADSDNQSQWDGTT